MDKNIQMQNAKTIVPMDGSGKDTLCVEIKGVVKREDHNALKQTVENIVAEYGGLNLLFYYGPEYEGWEPDAAMGNMETIAQMGHVTRRLAYVNPPEKKVMQHKIAREMFGGEIKYFKSDELNQAVTWIKTGEAA